MERLGFTVERSAAPAFRSNWHARWSIPCRRAALAYSHNVDARGGGRSRDFFASGHQLVEGIFAHFEDAAIGRVARFQVAIGGAHGEGLVALYKDRTGFDIVAIDSTGRRRPDWAAALRDRPLVVERVIDKRGATRDWTSMVRRVGAELDPSRRPHALAAIVVQPLM